MTFTWYYSSSQNFTTYHSQAGPAKLPEDQPQNIVNFQIALDITLGDWAGDENILDLSDKWSIL